MNSRFVPYFGFCSTKDQIHNGAIHNVAYPYHACWCSGTFNTLRPRQNWCHFVDNIFKCIFLNETIWISIQISLKFVPMGPINNISALVQIMSCWWGDKPLFEPMMVSLLMHICVTRPQWVKNKNIRRHGIDPTARISSASSVSEELSTIVHIMRKVAIQNKNMYICPETNTLWQLLIPRAL